MDLMTSPQNIESRNGKEEQLGLVPHHGISVQVGTNSSAHRPAAVRYVSTPADNSPLRHQHRDHSTPREVKVSLNARSKYTTSQDDGSAQHRINQYIIKQEIGRGSFGAVHLAVDQYGTEYAVKEFSKSRLRKRAQSHILRKPRSQAKPGHLAAAGDFNSPLHRNPSSDPIDASGNGMSIELIKEEIAIMKKLNHPNLCALIEVLDDPREDSLYMVMEMCKKGIIMKVGLDQKSDPYSDESCRYWFRDLILGIEYLHAQGIVHRDIKPDNCLLTKDDVLKVVDFGVSEMFEKDSEMLTAKSAGSPAFLPPELCVVKHGDISGKSADIWSMGVTLYCLKYGHIPFEKTGIFELYEAIKSDEPTFEAERDEDFRDLMLKLLEKDPSKRIRMPELREHPWVSKGGMYPLLSEAANTAELVGPPTDAEMESAITGNIRPLLTVMKAVNKFKKLVANNRPPTMTSILGEDDSSRFSQPPLAMQRDGKVPHLAHQSQSVPTYDRRAVEGALTVEGVHRDMGLEKAQSQLPTDNDGDYYLANKTLASPSENDGARSKAVGSLFQNSTCHNSDQSISPATVQTPEGGEDEEDRYLAFRPTYAPLDAGHARSYDESGHRGQAHDPLQDHLYLYIGPSTFSGPSGNADRRATFAANGEDEDAFMVSESPGAADIDIYETAYRDEIERIRQRCKDEGKDEEESRVYLTRRVDARLLAVGQLAGRFMAKGEEGLDKFDSVTGWKEKKARVTDVSRALRAAAREEYEKRRQERRQKERRGPGAGAPEADQILTEVSSKSAEDRPQPKEREGSGAQSPDLSGSQSRSPSMFGQAAFAGKAMEKGRQAKTSFKSLMGMVKERSNKPKDGTETASGR